MTYENNEKRSKKSLTGCAAIGTKLVMLPQLGFGTGIGR